MTVVNFIIAVIALIVAVMAYQRVGEENDLKEQVTALDSLREKAADLIEKLEKKLRREGSEEKQEGE
ncbi:MAG: hypothetical protein SWO11_18235 [Thermodesulfobacteriota bacterium]|nr:hypothetical protein [Thermodesulfobacteriota bacterium]